ncbi:hypothetical protein JL720_916 [Aureococcus anophagefferens]|nr:hypothetical protein JL720_916 [Aureococcus anophagefferens]
MAELVASSASSPLVVCSGPHGARVRADASLSSAPAFEMPRGAVARVLARRGVYRDDGRKAERLLIDWRGRQGWASAPFFAAVDETVRRRASSEAKKNAQKTGTLPTDFPPLPPPGPSDARLVSVVTPTTPARRWAHANLYECFARQTYEPRELCVYETGGAAPSAFWLEVAASDGRVRYEHEPSGDSNLGAKRNRLATMARGEVLAHFDDDDCYRSAYLARMAKLASFACFDVEQSELRVFDSKVDRAASEATPRGLCANQIFNPTSISLVDLHTGQGWPEWHSRTWGFGFCYVYTRALALAHPYDAAWHMGEDYSFLLQAPKRGAACVAFTDDDAADPAVLHVLHQGSTAQTPTRPCGGRWFRGGPHAAALRRAEAQRRGGRRAREARARGVEWAR